MLYPKSCGNSLCQKHASSPYSIQQTPHVSYQGSGGFWNPNPLPEHSVRQQSPQSDLNQKYQHPKILTPPISPDEKGQDQRYGKKPSSCCEATLGVSTCVQLPVTKRSAGAVRLSSCKSLFVPSGV
jgi:hypothetical protein